MRPQSAAYHREGITSVKKEDNVRSRPLQTLDYAARARQKKKKKKKSSETLGSFECSAAVADAAARKGTVGMDSTFRLKRPILYLFFFFFL